VLSDAIGELLPAAVAVALSPIPIVAVALVLDGPRARGSGPAFALGWVAGLTIVSVLVVLIAGAASDPGSDAATGVNWFMAGIGFLFLVMAARQWRKRPKRGETPEMPSWMASINSVSPMKAVLLGAALSGANPKNLALTFAASAAIANAQLDGAGTAIAILTFVAIGSITVVGAVLFHLAAPAKAARPLATIKQFMTDNNATIMMVILVLLGVKLLGDALAGVWSRPIGSSETAPCSPSAVASAAVFPQIRGPSRPPRCRGVWR
jgi:threonine/homoserine/homoserine lactone efflux protein